MRRLSPFERDFSDLHGRGSFRRMRDVTPPDPAIVQLDRRVRFWGGTSLAIISLASLVAASAMALVLGAGLIFGAGFLLHLW